MNAEINGQIIRFERNQDVVRLTSLLASPEALRSVDVRCKIVTALGSAKDRRAVDALFDSLVTDDSRAVRLSALRALESMAGVDGIDAIRRSLAEQTVEGLLVLSIESLSNRTLPHGLEDEFIAMLDNGHGSVRAAAARALGRSKDPRSPENLVRLLGDKRRDVRVAALKSIVEIGDVKFTPEIHQAANKEHWPLRWILRRAIRTIDQAPD